MPVSDSRGRSCAPRSALRARMQPLLLLTSHGSLENCYFPPVASGAGSRRARKFGHLPAHDASSHAAGAAARSGCNAAPASSRRPKILSRNVCGGGAAASADAAEPLAAAAARFSMEASESPGMSGRLEGRSQGWAAVLLPLTLIGEEVSDAGGVGGCMRAKHRPSVPHFAQ